MGRLLWAFRWAMAVPLDLIVGRPFVQAIEASSNSQPVLAWP
jgi:hypothetical protein